MDDVEIVFEALPFEEAEYQRRVVCEQAIRWKSQAPCVGKMHWPISVDGSKDKGIDPEDFIESFCKICPYAAECLGIALTFKDTEAVIWGGLTGEQRGELIAELLAEDPDFYRYWTEDNNTKIKSLARRATTTATEDVVAVPAWPEPLVGHNT